MAMLPIVHPTKGRLEKLVIVERPPPKRRRIWPGPRPPGWSNNRIADTDLPSGCHPTEETLKVLLDGSEEERRRVLEKSPWWTGAEEGAAKSGYETDIDADEVARDEDPVGEVGFGGTHF